MQASEPPSPRPRIALSWGEVQRDCGELAKLLAERGSWRGIVAVSRGGLIPASLVSRSLDIRLIETVAVAAYDGQVMGAPVVLKPPNAAGDGAGWLVVDDLVDSGATIRIIRTLLPRAHVAVLYAKPDGQALADSYVRAFPQDCWLDFPWEVDAV